MLSIIISSCYKLEIKLILLIFLIGDICFLP